MEYFLFCYTPICFPTRAIYVPISLMDETIKAEMEKLIDHGEIITEKFSEDGIYDSNEDVCDILKRWVNLTDDSPCMLSIMYGIEDSEIYDKLEEKMPEYHKKSIIHYGHGDNVYNTLKLATSHSGTQIKVKNSVLYIETTN